MAIVPVENPQNIIAPTESPAIARANDYQRIEVPQNDPVPQALQHFGDVGVTAGQGLAQNAIAIAGLNNETAARNASTDAMGTMATRAADFFTKKGQNAVADYPQFLQDIQQTQKDAMGRMTNPQATNMLGASMAPLMRHQLPTRQLILPRRRLFENMRLNIFSRCVLRSFPCILLQ